MKRLTHLAILGACFAGLLCLALFLQPRIVQAQIDNFTYFVPYAADLLDDQFEEGANITQGGLFANPKTIIGDDIETNISIAIERDNTIIYYDHWENGLETNLTSPTQNTGTAATQIWGDNDPTTGVPPAPASDVALNAGDVIVLNNVITIPRVQSQTFFDGGDKFLAVGGNVAVALTYWPVHPAALGPSHQIRSLYAGAWELNPTGRWGTQYRIPIGENLQNDRSGFDVVGLNVQAAQDNTTVIIDYNGDGIDSGLPDQTVTLNQGEQFNYIGAKGATVGNVQSGSRVIADKPVQAQLFAAQPNQFGTANGINRFEARAFTLVPFDQWTNDWIAPRSNDGDFWLYNPNGTA
ncbi:MAG: hypothetical protein AAF485_30325, partial [Chloroflexota bacterium]